MDDCINTKVTVNEEPLWMWVLSFGLDTLEPLSRTWKWETLKGATPELSTLWLARPGSPQSRAKQRWTLLPQVTSLRLKVILAHSSRPQLDTTCKSDTFIKPAFACQSFVLYILASYYKKNGPQNTLFPALKKFIKCKFWFSYVHIN